MAVLIVLTVGFVVLGVIGDEVGQGEAVMRCDEVDRGPGLAASLGEQVGRSWRA